MSKKRFFWKFLLAVMTIVLTAHGVDWWLAHRAIGDAVEQETKKQLSNEVRLLEHRAAAWLRSPEVGQVQAEVQALGMRVSSRITVIRPDGSVVADSEAAPKGMENHAGRKEVHDALASVTGKVADDVRTSSTTRQPTLYVGLAVRDGVETLGVIRMGRPLEQIATLGALFDRGVLVAAAVGTLVALLLGIWFARAVTNPLREMSDFAKAVAAGQVDQRVAVRGSDEIGELGRSLNAMADELGRRMDTIQGDRNKLLAVLSDMAEGVVAVDREERVLHLNEVAARILGAPVADALGRRVWEITRVRAVCDALARAQGSGQEFEAELEVQGSDGTRTLDLKASPLRDRKGEVAGAVVVLYDVTRLRRLEVVRRDFVANVSHELKTPLTAIRGFVETLLDDPAMAPETQRRFLEKIGNQSQRLATLVTDLLTLSRVESGRDTFEKVALDLREPARLSMASLSAQAQQKGILLGSDLGDQAVVVRGDPEALRVVADNLLANAIQYTPAGGSVRVRVRLDAGTAVLQVEDSGIGIEPRDQERIFERFYRVDKARSRELGGTGLGLSIVKHIVLAHGGHIGVASEPGSGSTFTVRLPVEVEVPS